jgi:hypothetical protein
MRCLGGVPSIEVTFCPAGRLHSAKSIPHIIAASYHGRCKASAPFLIGNSRANVYRARTGIGGCLDDTLGGCHEPIVMISTVATAVLLGIGFPGAVLAQASKEHVGTWALVSTDTDIRMGGGFRHLVVRQRES